MSTSALRSCSRHLRPRPASSRKPVAPAFGTPLPRQRSLLPCAAPAANRSCMRQIGRRQFHAKCPALGAMRASLALSQSQDPLAATHILEPTPLTDEEYHDLAEEFLDNLQYSIEDMVEEQGSNLDAEYSSGVLTIIAPGKGTYVLNKQPPNKQIWLSSPISGPKRYDWVTAQRETGDWVYLRDGSSLTELLKEELDISIKSEDADE
ncbi:Mitochondrial chaperone Frataxin [Ascosphaera pollenicola]|nr:Mitochondrial chaperone Frataxin [Ascosphaera pollenicola]